MKKIFHVELTCPYCKKNFTYNILSFKAKKECPHCEYDLIVRTKMSVSIFLSIVGFILLVLLNQLLGIYRLGQPWDLLYFVVGTLAYVSLSYALLCKFKGPEKVYIVDMEDPTVLERKKRNSK